jgi:hypothetical protein
MSVILCAVSVLGMADAAAVLITALGFCSADAGIPEPVLSGSMSFGAVVTFLMFAVVFVLNLLVAIKGVDIEYGEGDLERAEIAKKIKSGELNIDDLPQPIVETSETRAIEEEIRKQHEKLANLPDNREDTDLQEDTAEQE